MTTLVTGANGFIGSALCSRLQSNGVSVRGAVRSLKAQPGGSEAVSIGSLSAETDWTPALQNVEQVVHLAARVHEMNEDSSDALTEFRRVNVEGTVALARQAAASGVRRFVFLSSIKVNGEFTGLDKPFTADDVPAPEDPYAVSKHEAEQCLRRVERETDLEMVIIRSPLVYGPGVKGNFARMVQWVRRGIPLPLGAVHNRRSLVALDNLVDFIALCASPECSPLAAGHTFLVSDGSDVSTSELLRCVAHVYGVPARLLPVPVALMKGSARLLGKAAVTDRLLGSLQVDASKARDLLGWTPPVSMREQLSKMALFDSQFVGGQKS
jgi:nucleoside-diphosphate-sugar epimerase